MKLIVGLGNPGVQYEKTRHNVGFMAMDKLVTSFSFPEFKKFDKFKALMTEGEIVGEKVLLVKPLTFMNLSGQSVQALIGYYKIEFHDLLVIYDDVEIPLGKVRLRPTGSAAGQKGIASIMQELGTMDIPRVRMGIKSEKPFPGQLSDYVLGKFTVDEQIQIEEILDQMPAMVELVIKEGIQAAMNRYN